MTIDKKKIAYLDYSHCTNNKGCSATVDLNTEVIKLFKAGKELSLVFRAYGGKQNIATKFPLKDFTKSYDELFK